MKNFRQKFFSHSRWSALLIGLIMVVLLSILVTSFVEKALRAGVSVKGIEQSTQAYYLATSRIETQLQNTPQLKKQPWTITGVSAATTTSSGSQLLAFTTHSTIPQSGKWNSPFDKNFNIISTSEPIQLMIPEGLNFDNVRILFRIPASEKNYNNNAVINVEPDPTFTGQIFFSFGTADKNFYLNNTNLIGGSDIKSSTTTSSTFSIEGKQGFEYNSAGWKNSINFKNFYQTASCGPLDNIKCVLKFSLIKPVIAQNHKEYPFLEYKIETQNNIPLQFMTLESLGWVGNYARERVVEIPQISTNTALDFAVLQ